MIALILLVVIGLTSAAAMRSGISHEKVVNNLREEGLAQQYAELALRHCVAELQNPSSTLINQALLNSQSPTTGALSAGAWNNSTTWFGATSQYVSVNAAGLLSSIDSSLVPATSPQCFVERMVLSAGQPAVYVVTARGFSPAYRPDANGRTQAGSVVWLQAILS